MVSQKFSFSKILIIIIAFIAFVMCSLPVRAEDEIIGVTSFNYNGTNIPIYLISQYSYSSNDGQWQYTYEFDTPVYSFFSFDGTYHINFFSLEPFCYRFNEYYVPNSYLVNGEWTSCFIDDYWSPTLYTCGWTSGFYNPFYNFVVVDSSNDLRIAFCNYISSDSFVGIETGVEVDWFNARSNSNFALQNVRGSVSDDVFTATWTLPDLMPKAEQFPILLDFTITDLATNENEIYYYPLAPDVYGMPRQSYYDVQDLTLSVDLKDIVGLPTDYRVDFVALTPYYEWVGEHSSMAYYYKGQTSSIYLNYTGHYDFTVQVAPDVPNINVTDEKETEKGILVSIQNFFSGFFSNFGNMLKDLFIPSKEQMQSLFADMETFFGDKLGFLWFPFDLAITIVETFTYGTADSVITVPPISLNILGGIDLYGGGQFDMDAVGIFPYVRMVSSIVLACSVATLAYKKWDEWIGGHDS